MFVDKEGVENVLEAPIGKSLLEVAHDNEIELEGEHSAEFQRGYSCSAAACHSA